MDTPKDTQTTQLGILSDLNIPPKTASNVPYLVTVAVMFLIGVVAVVLIAKFRPETDLLTIFAAVFAFLTPTTASILSFQKAQETHLSVNSRLDGFIKNAQSAALAVGNIQGRNAANARNDALANNQIPLPEPIDPSIPTNIKSPPIN